MEHFTPERYLRFGSLDDREAFLAAHEEWEEALSRYGEQLQRIRKELPPHNRSLRSFVRAVHSVYLHDAPVLAVGQSREDFSITLQPPSDPERLTVLSYKLVEEPRIEPNVLPPERCREQIEWLYDELDLDRPQSTLRHNILLSNGWEVTLRFRWARVKRPLRVIPVLPEPCTRPSIGSRSA